MFVNQLGPLEEQTKPTFTKHLQHYHLPGIMLYTGKLSVLKSSIKIQTDIIHTKHQYNYSCVYR